MTPSISIELTHAFGWSLIHALWQGLIIAFLLALVLVLVHEKSARLKYKVSVAAMAIMFIVWLATFLLVYKGYTTATSPLPQNVGSASLTAETVVSQGLMVKETLNGAMPYLVNGWLLGFMLLSLRFMGGIVYANRLKTCQTNPVPLYWENKLRQLQQRVALSRPVKMLESAIIKTPMVVGHVKPVILLPLGTLTRLPPEELEGILLHELGHILRNDYLVNLLQSFVETLLFYHPAIWWISNRIRAEREHCCDDIAIAASGDPRTFATALYHLQEVQMKIPKMAMAAPGSTGYLYHRIKRALGANPPSGAPERMASAILLLFGLFSITLFTGAANLTSQDMTINSRTVSDGEHTKMEFRENNRQIILEFENSEMSELIIEGNLIPPSEWSNHQAVIDSAMSARAHMEEQEEQLKAEEALMGQEEARMLQEEETMRQQEEAMRQQEKTMRQQEETMRLEEEIMLQEEESMRRQEELERAREREVEMMEREHEAKAIAHEAQERAHEEMYRATEKSWRTQEISLRAQEQKFQAELRQLERQTEELREEADKENPAIADELRKMEKELEARVNQLNQQQAYRVQQMEATEKKEKIKKKGKELKEKKELKKEKQKNKQEARIKQEVERRVAREQAQTQRMVSRIAEKEAKTKIKNEKRDVERRVARETVRAERMATQKAQKEARAKAREEQRAQQEKQKKENN